MNNKNEVLVETFFTCSVCKRKYEDKEQAEKCLKRGFFPKFKIGDIVFIYKHFGWFDGDKRWVSNPDVTRQEGHGNCFGKCCHMGFYYVITCIDGDPDDKHRVRYHLFTGAMPEDTGYQSGYTFDVNHMTPKIVKNPPKFIIKDSKRFIGKKANFLT